jgi:chromosome segregation ATPase
MRHPVLVDGEELVYFLHIGTFLNSSFKNMYSKNKVKCQLKYWYNRNNSDEEKALLKLDLAEISAERDSLTMINEKLQKQMNVLNYEAELGDAKHKNLKSKCKTLLNKHRGQSDQKKRLTKKLGAAKNVLINVDQLCRMHEKNYGLLMNYFGKCFNFYKLLNLNS